MTKHIAHYGVLGMKWGHRKSQEPNHPDQDRLNLMRKLPPSKLSDADLKFGADRMFMIHKYRNKGLMKGGKRPETMSNDELFLVLRRYDLKNRLFKNAIEPDPHAIDNIKTGYSKWKTVDAMDKKKVDETIKRLNLEYDWRDQRDADYRIVKKLVDLLLVDQKDTAFNEKR